MMICRNGVQQRRNSFQDGVYGTTCPIPPGKNFTYILQVKDQIGSFYYFPSLAFHKAAGGFGGIRILSRPRIPVPFDEPAGDYTVLIGDWYKANHTVSNVMLFSLVFINILFITKLLHTKSQTLASLARTIWIAIVFKVIALTEVWYFSQLL